MIQFLTGSNPEKVFAECISNTNTKMNNQDNVAITIHFSNVSVGLITYLACGDELLSKERIEIFGGGKSSIIDDFKAGQYYANGRCQRLKKAGKGHKEEAVLFIKSILKGLPSPISLESILFTTATTFRIIDSLQTGIPQNITIP